MCVPFLAPLGGLLSGGAATGAAAATTGTMAAISGLGTVMSAYGSYQQAKAQQQAAKFNAAQSDLAAQDAIERGKEEAIRLGRKGRALSSEQRATMAARGLSLESGSPLSLLQDTAFLTAADQAAAKRNAAREAYSHQVQGAGFRAQASNISPGMAMATSLVTGVGQVASQWYRPGASSATDAAWQAGNGSGFHDSYVQGTRATRTFGM